MNHSYNLAIYTICRDQLSRVVLHSTKPSQQGCASPQSITSLLNNNVSTVSWYMLSQ